jgi:galactose-1-phosphate uridylyltransferase
MHEIGQKILDRICEKQGIEKSYRFGFHLPPFNSIDHLHLHCFIEPLTSWKYDKVYYGIVLNSIEDTLEKLKKDTK